MGVTNLLNPYRFGSAAAPVLQSITTAEFAASVTKPASVANGDLLVIACGRVNGSATAAITGFTLDHSTSHTVYGGNYIRLTLFWRIADGSEGASFTTEASNYLMCARITGHRASDPIAPTPGEDHVGGANIVIPSITAAGNALIIAFGMGNAGVPANFTGFTSQFGGSALRVSSKTVVAGATGTATSAIPAGAFNAIQFAVNP